MSNLLFTKLRLMYLFSMAQPAIVFSVRGLMIELWLLYV